MPPPSPCDWLERRAQETPSATALVLAASGESIDFKTLRRKALSRARALAAAAPLETRIVGVVLDSALETYLTILSAINAGFAAFPISARLSPALIEERLLAIGAAFAVSDAPLPALLSLTTAQLCAAASEKSDAPRDPLGMDAPFVIIGTSGSTGRPKGAMLSGANISAAILASKQAIPLTPDDCWAAVMPFSGIGGLSVPLRCLEAGASCLIFDHFDAEQVGKTLRQGRVSHISLAPAMLDRLIALGVAPSRRLKCALTGGAALSPSLWRRALNAGWPVFPTYGMSETASQIATFTGPLACWRPGLAGRPIPGAEIALDAKGRVRIKGPMVMMGYANPDCAPGLGLDEDGWLPTSDLGRFDPDGMLEIIGRADHVLISGGFNVSPEEVERLIAPCPDLGAVAISGQSDPVWGEKLVALFTGQAKPDAVLAWCAEHIPSSLRPRTAIRLDALPILPSGKLDRERLKALCDSPP